MPKGQGLKEFLEGSRLWLLPPCKKGEGQFFFGKWRGGRQKGQLPNDLWRLLLKGGEEEGNLMLPLQFTIDWIRKIIPTNVPFSEITTPKIRVFHKKKVPVLAVFLLCQTNFTVSMIVKRV